MKGFYTELSTANDVSIIRASGRLTIGVGDRMLRQRIDELTKGGPVNLVVDVGNVSTIDSSGIGELVGAYTTVSKRGGRMVILHLPTKLNELLHVTQLITVFEVYEDKRDALNAVRRRVQGDDDVTDRLDDVQLSTPSVSRVIIPQLINSGHVLAEALLKEPDSIYRLTPRRFEELIFELVKQFGWDVTLTPATRDGGRDMVAVIPSDAGPLLCLIEAKRFQETRKVGVELVRQLWGTVTHEDACVGMLVTTSTFSPDARAFQQQHRFRLHLHDNGDVFDWLRRYCTTKLT